MEYKPLRNLLIIRPDKIDAVSKGGIVIPDEAQRFLNEGTIVDVGPEVSPSFRPDMIVVFNQHSEYKIKIEDAVLFVISEDNLLLCKVAKPSKLFPALTIDREALAKIDCGTIGVKDGTTTLNRQDSLQQHLQQPPSSSVDGV